MSFIDTLLRRKPKSAKERWTDRQADMPPAYLFDGNKATPLGGRRDVGQWTMGASFVAPHVPKGKLRDDDFGRAIGYLASEYAFNCIRLVATDIGSIPFKVRNIQTQDEITEHILLTAIHNARLYYQQDIIPLWQIQRYIFGEVYILPEWNVYGVVNCLRLLNPLAIEKYIPTDTLEGFDYQARAGRHRFKVEEIAFDKVSNPLDDINGLAPMSVALDAINLDKEIKRYTLDTFMKDMRMAGILTAREGSGVLGKEVDAVVKQLKEQRDSRLIGLPWQLEYQRVQQEIDSSQIALSEEARRRIAAALGIPQSVAGAWDSATFQSAPAQIDHYYRSVIFPECRRQVEFVNDFVMPFFDSSGQVEAFYDMTEVEALIEDKQAKTDLSNSRLKSGAITVNEYRESIGLEKIPDGDVYYLPAGITVIEAGKLKGGLETNKPAFAPAPAAIIPPAKETGGMKDAYLMLTMPNHPDLISLQRNVRDYAGDVECQWNDPKEFHITLLSMPAISDENIDALMGELDAIDIPEMSLNVGSLNVFDTGTNFAVHFKIRRNAALLDFQQELYDLCEGLGIPLSSYSVPDSYKPHITLGYAAQRIKPHTFNSKINVQPNELQLASNGHIIYRKSCQPRLKMRSVKIGKGIIEDALTELDAWRKKVKNNGAVKAIDFRNYLIRDDIAQKIREMLREPENTDVIRETFHWAQEQLNVKAIQATRIDFEDGFSDLLNDALAGKVTRRQFQGRLNSLLELNIYKAFVDGLHDAGIDDAPDEEDMATVNGLIADQRTYVSGLGAVLFKTDTVISDAMKEQKPALWYNGSIAPAYSAGLLSGDANGLYTWVLGNTKEHCDTCLALDGTSKRYKTWDKLNLIAGTVGQATVCQGWQCACRLVRKAGKSSDIELQAHVHEHV